MITIQKITIADCDGGGNAYVLCDDNDIKKFYEQFETRKEAEKALAIMEETNPE